MFLMYDTKVLFFQVIYGFYFSSANLPISLSRDIFTKIFLSPLYL